MASSTISPTKPKGGSFLIERASPEYFFSPEDFTDEHRAIARTTEEFWIKEIAPDNSALPRCIFLRNTAAWRWI